MTNEAQVFDALRKLTYSEMLGFAGQLRDTAQAIGMEQDDAPAWAAVIQGALDAFDGRDEQA